MKSTITSVKMRGGETVEAYLAQPKGKGPWPGLVILSEIYNANRWVRAVADGYAQQGFLCLAPDLYWRQNPGQYFDYTPEGQKAGRALGQKMDLDAFTGDMEDYVQALVEHPIGTGKVGTVGYCLGGKLVYLAAARDLVDVGIGYYAVQLEKILNEAGSVTRPLMHHFAELDARVPQKTVRAVKQAFDGKPNVEIYDYLGADHGFNRFGYPPFHQQSAERALERSLAYLRKHIA